MRVKELLGSKHREVITIAPYATVEEAMQILLQNKISCLPVVSANDSLKGIVSDKDIFRAAFERDHTFKSLTIEDLMSTELIVGVLDDDIEYIGAVMTNNRIRHVPIVDENRLIGLLSVGDIVKAQLTDLRVTNRYLQIYIDGTYPA